MFWDLFLTNARVSTAACLESIHIYTVKSFSYELNFMEIENRKYHFRVSLDKSFKSNPTPFD